jgi:hypothetical protein
MAANAAGRAHHPAAGTINPSQSVRQPGDAAPELARRSWSLFPCWPGDKRPAVDHWEQRACADPERVARHWPSPNHNIGVACGPSGLIVIDLDTHDPLPDDWKLPGILDGRDVLAQLCEWARQRWPSTYMVATPLGGWHLYYQAPAGEKIRNSAGKLGPSVDIRGGGGYVVGAGSVVDERAYPDRPDLAAKVKGGKPYMVLDDRPPVPLPGWITRMLARPVVPKRQLAASTSTRAPRLSGLVRTVETAPQGQRNDALYWAACRAVADGADPEALLPAALTAGLTETEARRTIRSAAGGQ